MHVAATQLKQASVLGGGPDWLDQARAAVRTAIVAVEQELGEVAGADGFGEQITAEAPRLLPQIERLEAGLADALVALWHAKQTVEEGAGSDALVALSRRLESLAEEGFGLAYESLTPPGGED
jgi:hypothetical protein